MFFFSNIHYERTLNNGSVKFETYIKTVYTESLFENVPTINVPLAVH